MRSFARSALLLVETNTESDLKEVIGTWRSLVARLTGGQEVAGSNPVVPIFTTCC